MADPARMLILQREQVQNHQKRPVRHSQIRWCSRRRSLRGACPRIATTPPASNRDTTSHGRASTTSWKMLSQVDCMMPMMNALIMATVSAVNSLIESADRITLMEDESVEFLPPGVVFHLCGLVLLVGNNGI